MEVCHFGTPPCVYRFKCLSAADYHSLSQMLPPVVMFSSFTGASSSLSFSSTITDVAIIPCVVMGTMNASGLKYSFFMILSFF